MVDYRAFIISFLNSPTLRWTLSVVCWCRCRKSFTFLLLLNKCANFNQTLNKSSSLEAGLLGFRKWRKTSPSKVVMVRKYENRVECFINLLLKNKQQSFSKTYHTAFHIWLIWICKNHDNEGLCRICNMK